MLSALAAAFVISEALAVLAVSLGLWEATLVTRLGGKLFGRFRQPRGPAGKAAADAAPAQPPPADDACEAPHPEPSASTQPSAPAPEPSGRSSLAPHALDGLPSEVRLPSCLQLLPPACTCLPVCSAIGHTRCLTRPTAHPINLQVSFTFMNAVAHTSSEEDSGGSGPSGGASELPLAAVAEGSGTEGGEEGEEEDSFDSCTELTFEPSAAGAPGITLVQRSISGLGAVQCTGGGGGHATAAP